MFCFNILQDWRLPPFLSSKSQGATYDLPAFTPSKANALIEKAFEIRWVGISQFFAI